MIILRDLHYGSYFIIKNSLILVLLINIQLRKKQKNVSITVGEILLVQVC